MTSAIEGIGDEVVTFGLAVAALLIAACAHYAITAWRQRSRRADNVSPPQPTEPPDVIQDVPLREPEPPPTPPADDNPAEDAEVVRQRRLQFFEHQREEAADQTPDGSPQAGDGIPDNAFRIRLKYLDDTERHVYAIRTEEVKDFKRRNFPEDVAAGRAIRLIYNGQVLRPDGRRMGTFDLTDECVVHVHVAQGSPRQEPPTPTTPETDLELGHLTWPLFACMLGVAWVLHFQYRELFTTPSSVALTALTGLFAAAMWSHYGRSTQ